MSAGPKGFQLPQPPTTEDGPFVFNGRKVLDVHAHVSAPIDAYSIMIFMLGANTPMPTPVGKPSPKGIFRWDEDDIVQAMSTHVTEIDARNIDVQILGPRPFLGMGWMPDHLQGPWTRHVNEVINLQCTAFPERFLGACQLPHNVHAPDAAHCLPELNRCVEELGFVAAYVSPDPDGKRTAPGLHDKWWDP